MLAAWADTPKVRATSAWLAPWANMRAASRRRSWRPAKSRRQVPTLIGLAAAWRVVALMPPACQHHLRLSSYSAKLFNDHLGAGLGELSSLAVRRRRCSTQNHPPVTGRTTGGPPEYKVPVCRTQR